MRKILVVAAHPDDEVLGCGASVARFARQGAEVRLVILGEGLTSRADDPGAVDRAAVQALHDRAAKAAAALGCPPPALHSLPDNRFDTLPLLDIAKLVEREVAAFAPDTVLTHFGGDLNVDHGQTFRAVLTALRPMAGRPVRRLLCFEVPSATEWAFGRIAGAFQPDTFVDVSATLEAKVAAMQAYESEARAFPHPRSPEALRALAATRGAAAGVPAAEAFQTVFAIL